MGALPTASRVQRGCASGRLPEADRIGAGSILDGLAKIQRSIAMRGEQNVADD
jgi:hypothetical protein